MSTVPKYFSSTVARNSDRIAVAEEDRRVTYGTLDRMVRSLARFLKSRGIKKGDKVARLLPNSLEFITSFFSVVSLGAVSVPLNTAYKEEEIKFYVSHSNARLLLTQEKLKPLAEKALTDTDVPVVVIKGDKVDWSFSEGDTVEAIESPVEPDDEAVYLYSTGSTGRSKRVARTHLNLTALADNHTQTVGWKETDRILFTVPLFHTYGFGNFISAMKAGASMYVLSGFNRSRIIDFIEKEAITVFPAVPFMLDILAETYLPEPRDFSSLRLVTSAGAPLSREIFYKFHEKFGIYPRQLYGSTETGVIAINLSENIENKFDSVGRPVKNVEVKIFREDGSEADVGEVGEIAVKSPSMVSGYYGLPDETRSTFRDEYCFMGDLGKKDEQGYIYIVGRKKLFINVSGNKVDPTEVESFLLKHPKIKEAVILGLKDEHGNESVKAVVVPSEKMEVKEIYEYCRGQISNFKIPRTVEFRNSIPKSPTGKVLREQLK
ncbi:MAG TPA: class I adenylate-forming enzyme family protein [Thermodesulfobacteriota bacterium]|nr:class I adenylate-forming enzyme family protein [Thermodesulfobacteriota bacterium]